MLLTIYLLVKVIYLILLSLPQAILDQLEWILTLDAVIYLLLMLAAVMIGTTFGVAAKHIHAKDYTWNEEDKWFYLVGATLTFGFFLWQIELSVGFALSTSLKTLLAYVQNRRNIVSKTP